LDAAEREHIESLLETHRAVLRVLEQQQATLGVLTPPHIVTQIAEYRQKIAELEARLRSPAVHRTTEPRHNLPQRDYELFVGRQKELAEVRRLLSPRSRAFVITIDGIGGIGKSALVLESAYTFIDQHATLPKDERFEAIIWVSAKRTYLNASGIHERRQVFRTLEDVFAAIARVLDYPAITSEDLEDQRTLVDQALREQRTLLILDNLETVDDDDLMDFLHELPEPTKALITTRQRIDAARPLRLVDLPRDDALALIAQEAARKNVTIAPEQQEKLWRRTGGLPLAVVWSIGLMSVGHGIDAVLQRLGSGQNDLVRFCFAESSALIHGRDAERLLLALALFERSVNRSMLGEVAGLDQDLVGRDEGLAELLQLSLIDQKGDRFKLLPLTHSFALEELLRQPDLERELRERWVACLTVLARPYMNLHWHRRDLQRLRLEGKHLVPLAQWAIQKDRLDILLDIAPAAVYYFDLTGEWSASLKIAQIGLDYARLIGKHHQIVIIQIYSLAWIYSQRGMHDQAIQAASDALETARLLNDQLWQSEVHYRYSAVLRRADILNEAIQQCDRALQLCATLPESERTFMKANIHHELGKLSRDQGDWKRARDYFLAAQSIFDVDEDDPVFNLERAWGVRSNLAFVDHQEGKLEEAAQEYERCLAFFRETGGKSHMTTLLVRSAAIKEQLGNRAEALAFVSEALVWSRKLGLAQELAQAEALLAKLSDE
jgi:tetratricopeptide (TPR) repeat protein